jgi:hypothetical protein
MVDDNTQWEASEFINHTHTPLELTRCESYRRSQLWIKWTRHGSRMRMLVRDIHTSALHILQQACDVSAGTDKVPVPPSSNSDGTWNAYDTMFARQMESTCQSANMHRMYMVLVLLLTTLQETSVKCFCPHNLNAVDDDLTAFRMEWSLLQCHAWPDVCSLQDINVGMQVSRLRDVIEFISRHLIAWTADAHFESFAADEATRDSGGHTTTEEYTGESRASHAPALDMCTYWQCFAVSLLAVLRHTSSRLTPTLD